MENPYFGTISSVSSLDAAIRREGGGTLRSLATPDCELDSASKWRRQHLLACRVIVKTGNPPAILPILQNSTTKDETWPPFIRNFIDGPPATAGALGETPEHRYVRLCEPSSLGSLWAALGEFYRYKPVDQSYESDNDSDVSMASGTSLPPATRPRSRPQQPHPGFVNSSTMQVGSSSPQSSSSSHPGSVYIDGRMHGTNAPSEEATLHFFRLALSHVLNYGPPQHNPLPGLVHSHQDFVPQKNLVVVSNHQRAYNGRVGNLNWKAVDDGGLDIFSSRPGRPRVCHLEAKNKIAVILDGTAIPSDSALAQMASQALAIYTSGTSAWISENTVRAQNGQGCVFFPPPRIRLGA
ncbi:hypothetical protein QBC47DRAFT_385523 [Echria macrotheca]|uniref:Uncharacterized protein n=1 Tax=Echria macrotheca TaxID=438768 RepID=A0AAJ0B9B6_9PEZI|nr:hypothetical protein QBC47DRAFT_385523 [Echria macrotheca]